MNYRAICAVVAGAGVFCAAAVAASGPPQPPASAVTINGMTGNGLAPFPSLTLTQAQLAALPQQTITVPINGVQTTETGPLVSALLKQAGLVPIAACKNDDLRYFVEASSLDGSAAEVSDGEIDPMFGNKGAILSLTENGSVLTLPRLVVPGDANGARDVRDVFDITVGRADTELAETTAACNPPGFTQTITPPALGSVLINGAVGNPTTVSLAQLAALPQVTQTDQFNQGKTPKTVVEIGPTLFSVLQLADPMFASAGDKARYYVEATSSEDGSATLASWAEFDPALNGNQMLLSLNENGSPTVPDSFGDTGPRLTAPGDVAGGRYDFGVQVLTVFRAPTVPLPAAGSGPSLRGDNLSKKSLANADLAGASMQGANLNGTDLTGAILTNANLAGANLNNANLAGALLNGADLAGANLDKANLTDANLGGADVKGANLNHATWSNTTCPDGSNSDSDGGRCVG
jgi:hypothetical protein